MIFAIKRWFLRNWKKLIKRLKGKKIDLQGTINEL